MDIGLIAAFVGGILALLSPCGALLLPAFFASSVGGGLRLAAHGLIFFAGLLLVLVPLGLGAGAVGTLFISYRGIIVLVAAILLIGLGLMQLFGFGFDAARFLPGAQQLQQRATSKVGIVKTFLLGAASGIAGFCAGPILGAVLTLAAAQGDMVLAGVLLACYGAGMVVPLMIIAWAWNRMSAQTRQKLRGRSFTFLGRRWHTTSVLTGLLLIGVGVLFWTTNGLVTMPQLIPVSVQDWLQQQSSTLSGPVADIVAIVVLAAIVLAIWLRARRRSTAKQVSSQSSAPGEPEKAGAADSGPARVSAGPEKSKRPAQAEDQGGE